MSADFWAGYISGAAGILIGNPLDLVKTRLQAAPQSQSATSTTGVAAAPPQPLRSHFDRAGTLVRGAAAPIIGYGALNALLFVSYNRTLALLTSQPYPPVTPGNPDTALPAFWQFWAAGAVAGLTTFVVSAPTELVKCRAQVASAASTSSWSVARSTWARSGLRGLYHGGAVTSMRDAVGYGFYFWAYESGRAALARPDDSDRQAALKVLLCGGLAGVVTWASIFPLDVVKTRVQTQGAWAAENGAGSGAREALLAISRGPAAERPGRLGAWAVAREAYRAEGWQVFFRGLGICSVRAFIVNAVQWAAYEWMMQLLRPAARSDMHQVVAHGDVNLT